MRLYYGLVLLLLGYGDVAPHTGSPVVWAGQELQVVEVSSEFNSQTGVYKDGARGAANLVDGKLDTVWEVHNLKNDPRKTYSWITLEVTPPRAIRTVRIGAVPYSADSYLSALRPRKAIIAVTEKSKLVKVDKSPESVNVSDLLQGYTKAGEGDIQPVQEWTSFDLDKPYNAKYIRVIFPPAPSGNASLVCAEIAIGPGEEPKEGQESLNVVPPSARSEPARKETSHEESKKVEKSVCFSTVGEVLQAAKDSGKPVCILLYRQQSESSLAVLDAVKSSPALEQHRERYCWGCIDVDSADGQNLARTYHVFRVPAVIVGDSSGNVSGLHYIRKVDELVSVLK